MDTKENKVEEQTITEESTEETVENNQEAEESNKETIENNKEKSTVEEVIEENKDQKKEKKLFKKDKNAEKVKELESEVEKLKDSLLRQQAEFINYRKRIDDEKARIIKFCHEDIIEDILPTLDNFERAINMDDDNLEDEVSKFLSGFIMIYNNFIETLKKYGVEEIDCLNKKFDANVAQAVMTKKVEDTEADIVVSVLQKGYILKGKVIRPAMVIVSE